MDALPALVSRPPWATSRSRPSSARLLSLANELGRTRFAPRAAQWDETRAFPSPTTTTCARPACWGCACPKAHGGLGADYATYMMVAAEIGRFCGATALTFNMHVCSTLWTGVLADGIAMTDDAARRARSAGASCTSSGVVQDGAIYAQPFSEGSAAAAGRAPFGTTARKVEGGWLVNGRKIFASLSGAADYYGVLCTEDKGDQHPDARDTLYLAVPGDERRASRSAATGTRWACAAPSAAT